MRFVYRFLHWTRLTYVEGSAVTVVGACKSFSPLEVRLVKQVNLIFKVRSYMWFQISLTG